MSKFYSQCANSYMNKVIITTGYMASGSSAFTDLLSEYDGVDCSNSSFEYIFLHCPNGLFDLEDKLLIGNNAIRSDEALHCFIKTMTSLYNNSGHWTGNYKKNVSERFLDDCNAFINELDPMRFSNLIWYNQENPINNRMKAQLFLRRVLRKLSFGKVTIPRPISYKDTLFAFPSEQQFYSAARHFLDKFYKHMGIESNSIVLDQLILPQNLNRMKNYFNDDMRVVIVDRDPRDVFISNKYIYHCKDVPFPSEASQFCKMYRSMRELNHANDINDKRILRVHFEDLIYNYQDTVDRINSFIGVDESNHIRKMECFNPSVSIFNTQLFRKEEYKDEGIELIENELNEYLYPFSFSVPNNNNNLKPF